MELLVTLAIAGIMIGIGTVNLMELSNPARTAANEIAVYLKRARAKALSTTSAYTLSASSSDTLVATYGNTCSSATQTADTELTLTLDRADLTDTSWSICFTSRGFPDANVEIPVTDVYEGSNTVEVLLGGSIRVL